jgi:Fe-S-cluster containining protein
MSLEEKVKSVEEVFRRLDTEISTLQSWSGLHCKAGCGKCCFKPDIEATVLEFLPFAYHLYKIGESEAWLAKVENAESGLCPILNPTQGGVGLCSEYAHRGLICRLFGYSARTNKYDKRELVTCQIIKTEQTENFNLAQLKVSEGESVPVMNQYYMQLHGIDFELTHEFYPIKVAIKKAIETVLQYYAYR